MLTDSRGAAMVDKGTRHCRYCRCYRAMLKRKRRS
ncbi:unnamed protein product [Linum tenue]|uniref:Uncharacterized protein n=1 Tax=Linum tenue TaxID=586396 RepID=A0AAV0RL49_9ROSI|nr:unnamed protein product [Linum tenue]